jgi:hypothetical protein
MKNEKMQHAPDMRIGTISNNNLNVLNIHREFLCIFQIKLFITMLHPFDAFLFILTLFELV